MPGAPGAVARRSSVAPREVSANIWPTSSRLAMTVTRFTAYVHNPRRMPPYTDKVLSDAQLADLFAYIKSLPVSPSADQIPLLSRIMAGK